MINPEELRKGNLVYDTLETTQGIMKTIKQIECLHKNTVEFTDGGTNSYHRLEPITLDEDWLRINFKLVRLSKNMYIYRNMTFRFDIFKRYWMVNFNNEFVPLKSVHKFQNFYFFTQSKEKEVKHIHIHNNT